jgi:protein-tyrosine-phosphatase
MRIVALCTGNVCRSVMLETMLRVIGDANDRSWEIRGAGTHVIAGQPVSARTLAAIDTIDELAGHRVVTHRSHELTDDDVAWADVILAAEADHVAYVRARFPASHDRAVQLGGFCRLAPLDASLAEQLRTVIDRPLDDALDVRDPAGGDQSDYDEVAAQLWGLAQTFATIAWDDGRS